MHIVVGLSWQTYKVPTMIGRRAKAMSLLGMRLQGLRLENLDMLLEMMLNEFYLSLCWTLILNQS